MFTPLPRPGYQRSRSLAASFAIHFLLLLLILRGPRAPFVTPSATIAGANGTSIEITYLAMQEPGLSVPAKARARHHGSPFGSLELGPANGHEVRPALPIVFPEPMVSRADIPPGVQGDVVVEVTIDAEGNVIGTKILASLGYGIEEKVLAALQNWRFRPATRDNVPIPSQHNVYFHYPK